MSQKLERIAGFLAQGFKPIQVASIVGCTPAYISQLAKDQHFQELYSIAQAQAAQGIGTDEEEERLNNKYLAAEHVLIDGITSQATLMEPKDQIRALDVIASRQERRLERLARLKVPQQAAQINNIIQLNLPSHTMPECHINSEGQITAVGQRLIAPMSSDGVRNLFQQMKEQRIEQPQLEDF